MSLFFHPFVSYHNFAFKPSDDDLRMQNKQQGLGFYLSPTDIVIDTASLKKIAAQLFTGGSIVGAYLLALANPTPTQQGQCMLTATQSSLIQAAMVERNESCSLNMTLASILDADGT